jgi:hypothetical protein
MARNLKVWSSLNYSKESKSRSNQYQNTMSSLLLSLRNDNNEYSRMSNKNTSPDVIKAYKHAINKRIAKLRELNKGKNCPFERIQEVEYGKKKVEYKETLFFIEYPQLNVSLVYQRSHIIDFNVLSKLNKSVVYGKLSLYSLALLLWTLEMTCCYADSTKENKEHPKNKDISVSSGWENELPGINNVNVYLKEAGGKSRLISTKEFLDIRKELYEIKESLTNDIKKNLNNTEEIFNKYSRIFSMISLSSGIAMDSSILDKIVNNIVDLMI